MKHEAAPSAPATEATNPAPAAEAANPRNDRNSLPEGSADAATIPAQEAAAAAAIERAERALQAVWADSEFDAAFDDHLFMAPERPAASPITDSAAHALAGFALASVTSSWIREPAEASPRGGAAERHGNRPNKRERNGQPSAR